MVTERVGVICDVMTQKGMETMVIITETFL